MKTPLIFKKTDFIVTVTNETEMKIIGRFLRSEDHLVEKDFFTLVNEEIASFIIKEIYCEIEYLNDRAKKELLFFLGGIRHKETRQKIIWAYEEDDETILHLGEHYKDVVPGYEFEFKEIIN